MPASALQAAMAHWMVPGAESGAQQAAAAVASAYGHCWYLVYGVLYDTLCYFVYVQARPMQFGKFCVL